MEFCENCGLFVLNGSTVDDKPGNFTFISTLGQSVNDVCAVDQDVLKITDKFEVDTKVWSDHMPITLILNLKDQVTYEPNLKSAGKLYFNISQISQYSNSLTRTLRQYNPQNAIVSIKNLNQIIMQTQAKRENHQTVLQSKEKWFNWKCFNARRDSFKSLRQFKRTNLEEDRLLYVESNKQFQLICEEARTSYYYNIECKLNTVKDSKEWWKLVKELKNENRSSNSEIAVNEFRVYFEKLLNPEEGVAAISYAPNFNTSELLDSSITGCEVEKMLKNTKVGKAAGEDKIPYEFYRYATTEFQILLAKSFTHLYENCVFDQSFQTSLLFPIFKKGDKTEVRNYRGISFMNCVAKILMGILTERLTVWVSENKVLNEFQAGFRKKYSTVDNVYNLVTIVHLKLQEKKKVYAFFVDFRAAFDKVCRSHLFFKLNSMGVSTKFVNFLKCIYAITKFKIWTGEEYSEDFETHIGLKQGCLMSPVLFSMYINDLHDYLEGGLFVDDLNIRVLLYADDIVILSDDVVILQQMIGKLEEYCSLWNMEVNLEKSAIMVFRKGGKLASNEKWKYKGEYIKITAEYTYLGVILTPRLSFVKHLEARNSSAKSGINSVWKEFLGNGNVGLSAKYKMFEAVSRSVQCYAAQVWGYSMFELVDKLQLYFIKKILRLPDCTPTYSIILETQVICSHFHALTLHMNYIRKTLFEYDEDRLPRILSEKILRREVYWAVYCNELEGRFQVNFNLSIGNNSWKQNIDKVIVKLRKDYLNKMWERSMASSRLYKELDHNVGGSYMKNVNERFKITWIFKCRADLIVLNKNSTCPLCNLNELESFQHFFGICPILKRIRHFYFGKVTLTKENIIDCLNGINDIDWSKLVGYITNALNYRTCIINEFN